MTKRRSPTHGAESVLWASILLALRPLWRHAQHTLGGRRRGKRARRPCAEVANIDFEKLCARPELLEAVREARARAQ